MSSPKIHPTCRICEKLNAEMTHCAVFGAINPTDIDNTALAAACAKSGDYIRLLHAKPNEFNYGRLSHGQEVDETADNELLIFDASDESAGFYVHEGMTLAEWAKITFGPKT